jgi:GTP pyrophosphokinase
MVIKLLSHEGILADTDMETVRAAPDDESRRVLLADAVRDHLRRLDPPEVNVAIQGLMHPVPVRLAGCCRPDFGDDIMAYVSRERGAAIHRRTCRSIRHPVEHGSAHVVDARWKGPPRMRVVRFDLTGNDRRGLLLNISHVLAELIVDAQAVRLNAVADGTARGFALLEVTELTDLEDVGQRIAAIPGITEVTVHGGS